MDQQIVHTRREFLHGGLAMISASATVPLFVDRFARLLSPLAGVAEPSAGELGRDSPILVVVQLAGGNDGLNTVIPIRNDMYYKARPRLAVEAKTALRLTDDLALHPSAVGLKSLFDDGLLAILQGVGYPNPDRSHFVSTDIWATADPQGRRHSGWIGRYFDCTCKGSDRVDPKQGIAITQEAPLAMLGDRFSPVSFGSPEELNWRGGDQPAAREAFERLNAATDGDGILAYLQRTAMDARASAEQIRASAGDGQGNRRRQRPGGRWRGGSLSQQLGMVRRMIASGLPTRVYYVSLGGFDTHANQTGRHASLLGELGGALAEFARGLKEDGQFDRVLTMTFSEFGRRVSENGSQGTDHGAAAPLFVMGSRVRPGIHGAHPGLRADELDRGDLMWKIDFRAVYSTILSAWMKADAGRVLGAKYPRIHFIRQR